MDAFWEFTSGPYFYVPLILILLGLVGFLVYRLFFAKKEED
jgi:hypothetical protein